MDVPSNKRGISSKECPRHILVRLGAIHIEQKEILKLTRNNILCQCSIKINQNQMKEEQIDSVHLLRLTDSLQPMVQQHTGLPVHLNSWVTPHVH